MTTEPTETLLAGLRAMSAERRTRGETPAPAPAEDYDFNDLPDYRPIRLQLAALGALGLENPFYRLKETGTGTEARIEGRSQLSFSSYNYLGLNGHPEVTAAAEAAIRRWGVSASASRLVGGESPLHRSLEAALAAMQGTEAAVTFVSGHATNVTAIGALLGPQDLIIHDALAHNSVTTGAQLSGAARLTLPHNDLDWLERTLAQRRGRHRHVLIAVEGLYSMDGRHARPRPPRRDQAPLPRLADGGRGAFPRRARRHRARPRGALRRGPESGGHLDGHALENARLLRGVHLRVRGAGNLPQGACDGVRILRRLGGAAGGCGGGGARRDAARTRAGGPAPGAWGALPRCSQDGGARHRARRGLWQSCQ